MSESAALELIARNRDLLKRMQTGDPQFILAPEQIRQLLEEIAGARNYLESEYLSKVGE